VSGAAIEALGWSLVHFLWQGALVALVLEVLLFALRERSSRARYALRCGALGVMGLLPLATFLWLRRGAVAPPTLPDQLAEYLAAAERAAAPGWTSWLVAAWALGASACAARVLRDYARIRRLQSSAAGRPLPAEWQQRFEALARRMNVRAVVRVIDSAALAAPTVIGWLKPVVLVPARALTGLSAEQLEVVLVHELAHVRRHDYLVNLLQSALEALLFYQPAVWWVSHGIRAEREFCCDDAALSLTSDGVVYARALATLESWRNVQPELALSTLGGPLMTRIQRLIGIRPSTRPVRGPLAALGALLVIGSATAFANQPSDGQDPEQLKVMRKHLEEMQQRLDEMRAMLDESAHAHELHFGGHGGDEDGPEASVLFFDDSTEGAELDGDVEFEWSSDEGDDGQPHGAHFFRKPGPDDVVVLRSSGDDGDGPFVLRLGRDGDGEGLATKLKALIERHREDGERDRELVEKLHAHLGQLQGDGDAAIGKLHAHLRQLHEEHGDEDGHVQKLHEHLRTLLHRDEDHRGDGDVQGEADVEVIIRRDGQPDQHIRKRVPLGGGSHGFHPRIEGGNVELFFDTGDAGEGDHDVWRFGVGDQRFELRGRGAGEDGNEFWFRSDADDGKVRVYELKKRAAEEREQAEELHHRIYELKKSFGRDSERADEHRQRVLELKMNDLVNESLSGAGHSLTVKPLLAPMGKPLELKVEVPTTIIELKDGTTLPLRVRVQTECETPCTEPTEVPAETEAREIV